MIKRLSTAAIGVALVLSFNPAQAAPYFGFDGRNYGELPKAPNFGRQQLSAQRPGDDRQAPRKCLKREVHVLLDKIEAQFGPVKVISTCRPGARIAGSGRISRHASGNAVDFDAGSRKGAIIEWLIANHKAGGTMTYADMSHIHIDIGQHFVSLAGGRKYATRSSGGSSGGSSSNIAKVADSSSYQGKKSGGKSRKYSNKVAYGGSYSGGYSGGYSSSYSNGDGGMGHYTGGYATIYR